MRLAVISDIHGNLTAFETVLADLEASGGADMVWILGDLAVFGPRPAECIRRVKAMVEANEGKTCKVIGGNTDRYLVTGERFRLPSVKNAEELPKRVTDLQARDTITNWNLAQISWEDYEFIKKIRGAELALPVENYGLVIGYHAVPGDDEKFLNPDTPDEEAEDYLLDREGRMGIGGHTHKQMDRQLKRWRLVNVGSVGLSVDHPGFAQYGLFTFEGDSVTVDLRNLPYDVDALIADLEAVGYPVPEWAISRIRVPQG